MTPEQLAANISRAMKDVENAKALLTPIADLVTRNAQKHTPVRTGFLRDSITARVEGNVAYVGTSVEYAGFVHDGTRYMAARPFLDQGLNDSIPDIERMVADWGNKVVEKAAHG